MQQIDLEYVVIGAGVIGLAIARQLAISGREVMLLEKTSGIGNGISSRNSEVIHAGIYYPQYSLKAQFCVRGKALLYDYCRDNQVPHQRLGKLIVAGSQEEIIKLKTIEQHARQNGVNDISLLTGAELNKMEPELSSVAALFSPSTGIVDSHTYMLQLQADFESAGGQCVFNTEIAAFKVTDAGIILKSTQDEWVIKARFCINASGLDAVGFCKALSGFPAACLPKAYFAKGSYFSHQGKVPFKHLIYPVPVNGGLGVHLTLDMQGNAKFGPDVEWLVDHEPLDYRVDPAKRAAFYASVKRYWPKLEESRLCPDYAGIRPKLSGPHESAADFMIQDECHHGIKGLINLMGIESPGLTASLAIAEVVAEKLTGQRS